MSLEDYAKKHGLEYNDPQKKKKKEQAKKEQAAQKQVDTVFKGKNIFQTGAVTSLIPKPAKGKTKANGYSNPIVKGTAQVVDAVLNRPGYAFRNAMIQQDEDTAKNGYTYQWTPAGIESSGKAFWAGLTGEARPIGKDLISAELPNLDTDSIGGKATSLFADLVTNPVNFIGGWRWCSGESSNSG